MRSPATGFLHITRVQDHIDPVKAAYRLVFAPLGGRLRSRHPYRQGLDALTDFLRQAGVPLPEIELAWQRVIPFLPRMLMNRQDEEAAAH